MGGTWCLEIPEPAGRPQSKYLSSIGRKGGKAPTPDDDGRRAAQDRETGFSGRRRGAKKEGPRIGSIVRTYLIVILACTAGTTVILGLAILGLRRLLVLVREQRNQLGRHRVADVFHLHANPSRKEVPQNALLPVLENPFKVDPSKTADKATFSTANSGVRNA